MPFRGTSFGLHTCVSSALTAAVSTLAARVDVRVDRTFTVGGQPFNLCLGVQNVTRRNLATYSWNRRTNSQRFGEQQGIFPIVGFDWRF